MTRESIEEFRKVLLPFVKNWLLRINYENRGKSDAEEFEKDFNEILNLAIKALEQEPKTGHWKPYLKEGLRYQCSACDSRFDTPWEYCPHCGAKMAESEEI